MARPAPARLRLPLPTDSGVELAEQDEAPGELAAAAHHPTSARRAHPDAARAGRVFRVGVPRRGNIGIATDWAADLAAARRAFAEQQYDVIITDYRLPDGDGVALAREFATQVQCPPVLMLTAYSTDEKPQEAREAGVRSVLTKPVREADLVQALRDAGLRMKPASDSAANESAGGFDFSSILALQDGEEKLAE